MDFFIVFGLLWIVLIDIGRIIGNRYGSLWIAVGRSLFW